ncbi:hypothetical protein [Nonomuraea soli]|uniref:NADPH-dependent ferric siderophore reductase n=1 Tax=Nonomuraea soli TaxID=1032476 RepID=A0A7W0CNF3_9ACTN|nr:hypothetical protein [Nonomuraea soli]MBA2894269.1 NADPH-dependent ferric siderophore reductase [Nonomuraea soli]
MIRVLEPGEHVVAVAVLESDWGEDTAPIPGARRIRRVHRHWAPAASSRLLVDALATLDLPDDVGTAYIAGRGTNRASTRSRDRLVCDRLVCDRLVCDRLVCDRLVCDRLVCDRLVCDRLVCDRLVRERGWPREAIKVNPFWTPGKRGPHP